MSKSSERIQISKRRRFGIFARDGFTCSYCGKQPPAVTLVVDHVIPVKHGGTNDEDNLATSCTECNEGKGPVPLPSDSVTEERYLRLAQNHLEQIAAAELANKSCKAQQKIRKTILTHVAELTGQDTWKRSSLSFIVNLFEEFGAKQVVGWMSRAFVKVTIQSMFHENNFCKYLGGVARQTRMNAAQGESDGN